MPIRVACPACSSAIAAPDKAAGKSIACPKCGVMLTIPASAKKSAAYEVMDVEPLPAKPYAPRSRPRYEEDDDDDIRPRRRKKPKPAGLPTWVFVAPIVLLSVAVIVGLVAWQLLKKDTPREVAKPEPQPTPVPTIGGPAPVVWTAFDAPDGSFAASFPNGPPQASSNGGGSGIVLPVIPGLTGVAGQGGKATDLAKELGIEFGVWNRVDPVGRFTVSYSSMPAILGNAQTLESTVKDVVVGKRTDGSEVLKVEDVRLGGHPGKRILIRSGAHLIDQRTTKVKERIFTVTAGVPSETGAEPSILKSFFDSFAVKKVPDPKPLNLPGLELPPGFDPLKPS